ncbi:MAG: metallophosphoesterase [Polyangiaceae bacterium]
MSRPFAIAHISDFHVSTFGDNFHDRKNLVKRSAYVADVSASRHEVLWEEGGWRVLRERHAKNGKLTLVDPQDYAHPIPAAKSGVSALDPVERAAAKACRLEARRDTTLARSLPTPGAVSVMLEATPSNANVRLVRAARAVEASDVDMVIMTGDITDDGEGYPLVLSAFAKWRDAGRLLAVPGNHDIYLFPIAGSGRPRPTVESKRKAWTAFADRLGVPRDPSGAFVFPIPEADAVIVGLDSCKRPQRRFFRHNGAIGDEQLAYLRRIAETPEWKKATHRLVALHHHVVPLSMGVGRRAPTEIGMRLDDARTVAETFDEVGATLVLHGHRHISEHRQPAASNFQLLAAPSLTLGCKSGDVPSFWRIELDKRAHVSRVRVPVAAVDQENDPGTESEDVEV